MTATTEVRERVCCRNHRVQDGNNGRVRSDGFLVCYDCQNARYAERNPGSRRALTLVANPWAGQLVCPDCGSDEWTLPYDPTVPETSWRCVACRVWAAGPMREKAS